MARLPIAVLALLMASFPASASLIEDTLAPAGVTYQHDGGVEGDAPAECEQASADRGVALDGDASTGMLMDVDDEVDVYGFVLDASTIGERVEVVLDLGLLAGRYDVAFDVRSPDCASSVFDPSSAYYNPPPQDPYEGEVPAGFAQYEAATTGYACDPLAWKFLANQMGGLPAPPTVYVEWTDGSHEYVAVQKSTPATIAMYRTTSNLDVTVERAVIVLPTWWRGSFHIASGPCDAATGTPVVDPVHEPSSYGNFTVQEAGTHVVIVTISRGTVDKTVDTVNETLADPPLTAPVYCHTDICTAGLEFTSYDLAGAKQTA